MHFLVGHIKTIPTSQWKKLILKCERNELNVLRITQKVLYGFSRQKFSTISIVTKMIKRTTNDTFLGSFTHCALFAPEV